VAGQPCYDQLISIADIDDADKAKNDRANCHAHAQR
jgi:hypothetical protein